MILALFAALALTSPLPAHERPPTVLVYSDECDGQVFCWFDQGRRRCTCEAEIVNLGSWDPRPAPAEWPRGEWAGYEAAPPAYGAFPLEKHEP